MHQPDMTVWTGRDDTAEEGSNALRWHQCVVPFEPESAPGIALVGFACDEGVRRNHGRIGAAKGPRVLRKALANFAWDRASTIIDAGDVVCHDGSLESAQEHLAQQVHSLCRDGHRPLVMGGGHETAWGTFQGLHRAHPDAVIGVINIDAHFDLRTSVIPHSGTPFRQIANWCVGNSMPFLYACLGISPASNTEALYDTARQLGSAWVHDRDIDQAMQLIPSFLIACDMVHLSVDLDVLPGAVMPAVSAPAGRGVPPDIVDELIARVVAGGKLAACDVVEFNPAFDSDGIAARTAARIIWNIAHGWTTGPNI